MGSTERRHQRLASDGAQDKRISYGCVNAPEAFYNQFIAPLFGQARGVIYVYLQRMGRVEVVVQRQSLLHTVRHKASMLAAAVVVPLIGHKPFR
jgi:hypothetical protein